MDREKQTAGNDGTKGKSESEPYKGWIYMICTKRCADI